jgi:hypothetical protein
MPTQDGKAPDQSRRSLNRDRFVRIVERRVNRTLDALESLGNCANRRNYEYTEQDVKKIFAELDRKTREVKLLFQGTSQDRKTFKLA